MGCGSLLYETGIVNSATWAEPATIEAGPVMRYMQATAQSLHAPQDYIRGVLAPVAETKAGAAK